MMAQSEEMIQPKSEMIQPKSEMIQPKEAKLLDTVAEVNEDVVMEDLSSVKKQLSCSDSSSSDISDDEKDMRNRSCEEVDSDELDGDLNLSDNEEEARSFRAKNKASKMMAGR